MFSLKYLKLFFTLIFFFIFFSFSGDIKSQQSVNSGWNSSDTNLTDALPQHAQANTKALEAALNRKLTPQNARNYDLILISVLTICFYILTSLLYRFKIIKRTTHRKIWNFILLFMAIVALLGGFIIIIQLKYGILIKLLNQLMFWHVEAGISMTIIAVIHILWHRRYFLKIFSKH